MLYSSLPQCITTTIKHTQHLIHTYCRLQLWVQISTASRDNKSDGIRGCHLHPLYSSLPMSPLRLFQFCQLKQHHNHPTTDLVEYIGLIIIWDLVREDTPKGIRRPHEDLILAKILVTDSETPLMY